MMRATARATATVALNFLALIYTTTILPVYCFVPISTNNRLRQQPILWLRRNVRLPLLDLEDSDYANKIVIPLPSAHLPTELTTLNLYGMQLDRPLHKMIMEEALQLGGPVGGNDERVYGHLVYKPKNDNSDDLVGAIGCAAEILINAPSDSVSVEIVDDVEKEKEKTSRIGDNGEPMTVLVRGSYRFVVKEIIKSIPYPVAVVDELMDDEPTDTPTENDDEEDVYSDLDTSELVRRTIGGLKALVDQKLKETSEELTPLEQAILEDSGISAENEIIKKNQAEEAAAVLNVFVSSLIDICPMPIDRYYAIAMMAAEMANVDNDVRRQIIPMQNGVERLRVVLRHLEETLGMARARKMAQSITDKSDDDNKDLNVGTPELPKWASQIREGIRLEYYWNEEFGWCAGVVVDEPVKILDELIVTVRFEDGETHRLPFRADEKVRWRPAQ